MLDTSFHQGAGLHSFTPQSELRVLAVASQEQAESGLEMETLWQLCASLQRLGYPVVVLDGTAYETEASPGLHHLLRQAPWNEGASLEADGNVSSLAVLPAAKGLSELVRIAHATYAPPLQGLLPYFRAYGLLVLHAHGHNAPGRDAKGCRRRAHQLQTPQADRTALGFAMHRGCGTAGQRSAGTQQSTGCTAHLAAMRRPSPGRADAHHHTICRQWSGYTAAGLATAGKRGHHWRIAVCNAHPQPDRTAFAWCSEPLI